MRRPIPPWVPAAVLLTTIAAVGGAWGQELPPITGPPAGGTSGSAETAEREGAPGVGVDDGSALRSRLWAGPRLSGPVDPRTYRVGPGDVLVLQLWGKVSRTLTLEIGPEGSLLLPGTGSLQVGGLLLADVRQEVLRLMGRQFRGVTADLKLARPRTFTVYLTGHVRISGPVPAHGSSRVGDVVGADALREESSRRRIEVRHRDGSWEFADLDLLLRTGDDSRNPWLRDGDIVQVPIAAEWVFAHGAVARPGRFELGVADSLRTLLRLAGNPVPAADADRALLVRFPEPTRSESLWVRLDQVYSGEVNPPLHDGDRFYCYFTPRYHVQEEATILGEVERPGVYPIREGRDRLSDLVRAAGGFLPEADLWALRMHRPNPSSGVPDPELERLLKLSRNELTSSEYEVLRTRLAGLREEHRVDWIHLSRGSGAMDLLLRDGDLVRVDRLVSSIRVDGEVRRPGIVQFLARNTLADYVREVGGFTDRAWRSKVRVTRAVTGQTLLARNVRTLGPGDLIWVPERPDATAWDHARNVLTALAQIATVVIAIRSVN